ncbi:hypothetical protein FHS18_003828 [Paenibacillus phyllosphaerae]|uniref:Abhydrolase family protein n=1 Tax=Paenibacillus phyllosphaerae TaxID=274593 RepID=A0A7W5FNX3_9BACL|nr:alpha/beta fold hydrolase [Paenibacillus phyllosphaerae]MBB3111760.1 hypothetical protein [Paenibacillus phyllosphaerae]
MAIAYPIKTYYTVTDRMSDLFRKEGRQLAWKGGTSNEFTHWRTDVRSRLRELLALDRMESCPLEPQRLERDQMEGYRREKWLIQTEPGVYMPFYILIPDGIADGERRPAFVNPHGHLAGKYYTAGVSEIPVIKEWLEKAKGEPLAIELVRAGYIVFCPDARGAGERREWMKQSDQMEDFLGNTCTPINHMAFSMGYTLAGMMTWDLRRLLDYIATRDDCDPARIGCGGMSGGGMQTLWLAALDDRVSCAIISGYFYGFHDSHLMMPHNCGCNFVPNLWKYVDMGDIGALIAPRPLLIETGCRDHLNGRRGMANVLPQVELVRDVYKIYNAEEQLEHDVFDGEHEWNGRMAQPFLNRWLPI